MQPIYALCITQVCVVKGLVRCDLRWRLNTVGPPLGLNVAGNNKTRKNQALVQVIFEQ